MKAGTLLRIGIYIVGLWALFSGLSSSLYYLHAALTGPTTDFAGREIFGSMVYGNAIVPLFFALTCFGFGSAITRLLLGKSAEEQVDGLPPKVTKVLLKLLALYFIGSYGGHMIATLYELLAVRSGNRALTEVQVTSDLIANGAVLAFAFWLGVRTDAIVALIMKDEKTA